MSEQLLTFDQLIQLMGYVLSGDNAKIQEATKILKVYTKKVGCVAPLAQVLAENPNAQLRQLGAILLKRNIITLYTQLDQPLQQTLKVALLQRFFTEEQNVIRTNIGQIIGVIAQQTLSDNNWPELYQILQQQTQKGQDITFRQRGLVLLSLIFDYSGDALKPFYSSFFQFFIENLNDTDKKIRSQTVKCLISLFDNIQYMEKKEAQQYKTLVEPILTFVDQCLQEGDEDNAYHCFDAFSYLAESKLSILDNHLGMIVQYAAGTKILLNPKCSHKFKECVIDFIYTVSEQHKKILQRNQPLLKQLIEALSLLVAQPIKTQEYDEDEEPIQDIALWLIEVLCVSLPKKKVIYGIFLETITQLINTNDTNQMNAGFLILAAITEGLQDQLRRNLQNPIMSILIPKGLDDQRVEVRGAAIKTITYFSEFLCPEFLSYDNVVIPYLVRNLGEVDTRVREKGLMAIDIFAENMEEDTIPKYLPTLVPALVQMFIHESSNLKSKRLCLSSLGSIISSSRNSFSVYLQEVSALFLDVLKRPDSPEIMGIKAEAISCLGKIAEAFSTNPEVQQLISQLATDVYQLLISHQDYEIREACLSFFYNQASAQKEQFAPVFSKIIDFTINLAQSQEGVTYEKKKQAGEFSLDTDSDEDDGQARADRDVRVRVTQLDEKAAAIHALGQFAIAVPMCFGPYFKPVSEILEITVNYFYENVRIQSVHCYRDLIEGLVCYANGGKLPTFQNGLPCPQRLNAEAEQFIHQDLMQKLLHVLIEDESNESVVIALDAIENLMKKCGPAIIDVNLSDLTKKIVMLFEKKTRCFGGDPLEGQEFEQEEEELDEDEEDTNETILEALSDLLPQMAKTLKLGFLIPFQNILPHLLQYTNTDRDINEILQIVGCFAEIFGAEPATINMAINNIQAILFNATEIGDFELNRNTAFCLANIIEFGQIEIVQPILQQILLTLQKIYDNSGSYQAAVDNAAAAICKVIIRFPGAVPVETVLPSIMKLLPFKGDEQEEFTAVRLLLHLGNTQPELIQQQIDTVIKLLLDAVLQKDKYKIKDEKLLQVTNAIKSLAQNPQFKSIIESTVLGIPDEQQRNVLISQLQ